MTLQALKGSTSIQPQTRTSTKISLDQTLSVGRQEFKSHLDIKHGSNADGSKKSSKACFVEREKSRDEFGHRDDPWHPPNDHDEDSKHNQSPWRDAPEVVEMRPGHDATAVQMGRGKWSTIAAGEFRFLTHMYRKIAVFSSVSMTS